jgi:hypothetical protein
MLALSSAMGFVLTCAAQSNGSVPEGKPATGTAAACPEPADMTALHLYGMWRAQLDAAKAAAPTTTASAPALAPSAASSASASAPSPASTASVSATLRFERHPELAESVRGKVERDGASIQLAGDVDEGDFTLEESQDGQRISATWIGRVVNGSCGKEIRGTWTNAADSSTRTFVLRRQSGW